MVKVTPKKRIQSAGSGMMHRKIVRRVSYLKNMTNGAAETAPLIFRLNLNREI
jgi:hypothetical protein